MYPESRPDSSPAIEKLNTWKHTRLVLLVAPAGSGKTALLRKWAGELNFHSPGKVSIEMAWVNLRPKDNFPLKFLSSLENALSSAGILPYQTTSRGDSTPFREQTEPPTLATGKGNPSREMDEFLRFETGMVRLTNALSTYPAEYILVFDHYHHISSPAVHTAVARLLDYPPPPMHLVIASQIEPPLPLPRLRARRQMVEITPADLQAS
jgi:LuxR family transcriptional regulator, maltose regulon positive regulatory protein